MKYQSIIALIATASAAFASGTVYVASTGNDANPCTRTQPCRTFAGAQNVLTTDGNTILALDSADYSTGATLSLTYTVDTIDGGPQGASFTGPNGGAALAIGFGEAFTIKNLNIITGIGAGSIGISAPSIGSPVNLDHVTIHSTVPGGNQATAISATFFPRGILDLDHVSIFQSDQGVVAVSAQSTPTGAYHLSLHDVNIRNSGAAVQITDGGATIRDSAFAACGSGVTLSATNTSPVSFFEHTEFDDNSVGLVVSSGVARISNSLFSLNGTGISTTGAGSVISFRNNEFAGNGTDGAPILTSSLK
jgi:hypothetical protein